MASVSRHRQATARLMDVGNTADKANCHVTRRGRGDGWLSVLTERERGTHAHKIISTVTVREIQRGKKRSAYEHKTRIHRHPRIHRGKIRRE